MATHTYASQKGIKIAHFNVRSIMPKLESVKIWLEEKELDIVTFNETWLTKNISNSQIDLPDYTIIRQDRKLNKRGGGLITLLTKKKNIDYSLKKFANSNISNADAEIQAMEVKIGQIHKMIVVNCYRTPVLGVPWG